MEHDASRRDCNGAAAASTYGRPDVRCTLLDAMLCGYLKLLPPRFCHRV